MWTILKVEKKEIHLLKNDLIVKLGEKPNIYFPKYLIQKYKKNKIIKKEISLLGNYVFCYHVKFKDKKFLNNLKFLKGLKYFLSGFAQSQSQIESFINKCKEMENDQGYLTENFIECEINSLYKFSSGPFAEMIFKIINFQKNKINILLGNVNTTIKKNQYLFKAI